MGALRLFADDHPARASGPFDRHDDRPYLIKTGHRDKLRIIYYGCASAVAISVVTAFGQMGPASSASQEALEGDDAAGLRWLFSVSYWLISKLEARKWTTFIR